MGDGITQAFLSREDGEEGPGLNGFRETRHSYNIFDSFSHFSSFPSTSSLSRFSFSLSLSHSLTLSQSLLLFSILRVEQSNSQAERKRELRVANFCPNMKPSQFIDGTPTHGGSKFKLCQKIFFRFFFEMVNKNYRLFFFRANNHELEE